jgi:hypothetical protein
LELRFKQDRSTVKRAVISSIGPRGSERIAVVFHEFSHGDGAQAEVVLVEITPPTRAALSDTPLRGERVVSSFGVSSSQASARMVH